MKHAKVWGETQELFAGQNVELHRIFAKENGFCSKHYHDHKYNLFYIESGCLKIETWRDNGITEETFLNSGEQTVIPPKLPHRFTAIRDTVAIEFYWVSLNKDDIVRACEGGICVR